MSKIVKQFVDLLGLEDFLKCLLPLFALKSHQHSKSEISDLTIDSQLSSASVNPVENKVVKAALDNKVPTTRKINGKALSTDINLTATDVGADASGTATSAVSSHNTSTSAHNDIRTLISDLSKQLNAFLDVDNTKKDQLSELIALIETNADSIEAITSGKVNVSDIVNNLTTNVSNKPLSATQGVALKTLIDDLQTALDTDETNLASHTGNTTIHITATERTNWNDANRKKHSHDNKSVLDNITSALITNWNNAVTHISDTVKHITSAERTNWNAAKTHADSAHAPSNAQPNQNAFSNFVVGSTTISADTATDSLTLSGSNVTLTPDTANDKLTIGITKSNVTSALGYTPPTTDTTYSTATSAVAGLMSPTDKAKLDGIAPGATANIGDITGVTAGNGLTGGGSSGSVTLNVGAGAGINVTADAVSLATSGVTAGSYGPTSDVSGANGNTIKIPQVTVDEYGRVTGVTERTYTSVNTDNNTDTKVTQTVRTTDGEFPVLLRGTSAGTSTTTTTASFATGITANPSTGAFSAKTFHRDGLELSRIFGSMIPYGIAVAESSDLNTTEFLAVGNYYCSANKTVATLTNCPTTSAFMMQVLSPLSTTIDNETTKTWVYRLRKMQVYTGEEYIQYCYVGATAGTWIYGEWKRIVTTDSIKYATFTASGWSGSAAPYTQTVTVSEITADDDIYIDRSIDYSATEETITAYNKAFGIIASGAGQTVSGGIQWKVFKKPATDVTVAISIA